MIAEIVFSWNVLTATMVAWLGCVSLALAADFGPEIYRERKARADLRKGMQMLLERKAKKPVTFNPETTFQLGVFTIQPAPVKRRHARV